jgi:uncharacterized protein
MFGHQSTARLHCMIAVFVTIFGLGVATPSFAIDCTKASDPIDKRICGNAGLKSADAAMGQAYAALLKSAPDPEIRAMLVNSQRRWIAARNDRLGGSSDGVAIPLDEIRRAMVERTSRLTDRSDKGLVAQAETQRRFLAKYTRGAFSGFDTSCEFIPNDSEQKSFSYQCTGVIHVQNKERLCSLSTEFASWSLYTYHAVSTVAADQAKPAAICSDQSGDICGDSKKIEWEPATNPDQHFPRLKRDFPKLDAEANWPLEETDAIWFDQCLSSPTYPPAQ